MSLGWSALMVRSFVRSFVCGDGGTERSSKKKTKKKFPGTRDEEGPHPGRAEADGGLPCAWATHKETMPLSRGRTRERTVRKDH